MKFILHVDMNAFFASVEELQNPKYINKPIAVSGKTKRSVIASANYIARAKGVKAAMPVYQALNLCKDLIIVVPHFHLYHKYSEMFHQLIEEKITTKIEKSSIDECYVDISDLAKTKIEAINIAQKIQNFIFKDIKLKCSIGVSQNKFLAKMASDFKKPMGISTCFQDEIKTKLWPLDINEMLWIGKSTADLLKKNNIKIIGDLIKQDNKKLIQQLLDKNWMIHIQHANGMGTDELDYSQNIPKSISASETFLNDTDDFEEITKCLKNLTLDVITRLKKHQLYTKTITVYVKYPNFAINNKSLTISEITNDFEKIWLNAINLFQNNFVNKSIRLIGIRVDNLQSKEINLFSNELYEDVKTTDYLGNNENDIIKKINGKFKKKILDFAINRIK